MQTKEEVPSKGINTHFKREAKWMLWLTIGIPAVLTLIVFVGVFGLNSLRTLNINRCKDANGLFNYQTSKCEFPERSNTAMPR